MTPTPHPPPRMRIVFIGDDIELEQRLRHTGHRVERTFESSVVGAADMVLIAETDKASVMAVVETLPQLRGKILAHTCPGLPPVAAPGVVSVAFSRIHPQLHVWAVDAPDELGGTVCDILMRELDYQFVGVEYRDRLAAAYRALLTVSELPQELLQGLVRSIYA